MKKKYVRNIDVVLLCGGKGTRLREKTVNIPKPLVEIGGRPILWHVMKIYASYGFCNFILCLGYKGSMIKKYFANNPNMCADWKIRFVDTGVDTNTGGRIKLVNRYVKNEIFFANYSDGLSNIDLNKLVSFHIRMKKTATITCVQPLSPFGMIKLDSRSSVTEMTEKPRLKDWINGGFFIFNREVFKFLKKDDVLEKETFGRLVRKREMCGFRFGGFWACMDTYKDNQKLNNLWNRGKAPWKVW